jgi:hypothetical protein
LEIKIFVFVCVLLIVEDPTGTVKCRTAKKIIKKISAVPLPEFRSKCIVE